VVYRPARLTHAYFGDWAPLGRVLGIRIAHDTPDAALIRYRAGTRVRFSRSPGQAPQ